MSSKNNQVVKITLSQAQKDQIKQETGKDAEAIELQVSELEERIVPRWFGSMM
ncbi:MAG TPA: hypothetical protein VFN90_07825 [Gemmatimonadales bacterium]|nr:hypothetical protein [Gemmatimonadales bacterium]